MVVVPLCILLLFGLSHPPPLPYCIRSNISSKVLLLLLLLGFIRNKIIVVRGSREREGEGKGETGAHHTYDHTHR